MKGGKGRGWPPVDGLDTDIFSNTAAVRLSLSDPLGPGIAGIPAGEGRERYDLSPQVRLAGPGRQGRPGRDGQERLGRPGHLDYCAPFVFRQAHRASLDKRAVLL